MQLTRLNDLMPPLRLNLKATFLLVCTVVKADVTVADIMLSDQRRANDVACRVYFPSEAGPFPLIIFSHGFGADRTAFGPILKSWAARGYVVVAPSHLDGAGKSRLASGSTIKTPGEWSLESVRKTAERVADVISVMDGVALIETHLPSLFGRIDAEKIGVGGHSLGAYTAMLVGGVRIDIGGEVARDFHDPRVRCILPISAQGAGQQGLTRTSWAHLAVPMLTVTGSLDRGAAGQGPDWKKQPFELAPPGDKYLLYIVGANHVSFGGGERSHPYILESMEVSTGSFWDAFLKDDAAAKGFLEDGTLSKKWGDRVSLSHK